MDPRSDGVSTFANLANWIDGTRIYVTGLRYNQHSFVQFRHLIRSHSPLVVAANLFNVVRAEAEHRDRFVHGGMSIRSDDNANSGSSVKAFPNDIPPAPPQ